jgi:hypothetical protein
MATVWIWRGMMLVALPTLALLTTTISSQLPFVLADPGNKDRDGLILWAIATAAGAVALIASFVLRRRGRINAALALAAVVALPGLLGFGLFALIVGMFIAKG